jgi:putative heme-binding domain-containing protein
LIPFLAHQNAQLVRLAAEALGRIGDARAVAPLLAAAGKLPASKFTASGTPASDGERVLEHALIYALIEIGRTEPLLAQLNATTPPRVARVALVALDQIATSGLEPRRVLPFLSSSVTQLKQTAGWIVTHRPDWGDALAGYYRQRLESPGVAAGHPDLQAQLSQLAKSPEIQDLLAASARSGKAETRLLALRAMAAAPLKETPARWLSDLATLLAERDATLLRQVVTTVRALPLPKTVPPALARALGTAGRDRRVAADIRLDALAASPATIGQVEPELFEFLRAHLDAKQPMVLRSHAAATLARAPLNSEQQLALADAMKTVGAIEAPKLLPAFERAPNEMLGNRLMAALRDSPARAGLRGNVLKPVIAKYPPNVQQAGEALIASLNSNAARENARVDELLAYAKNGDIRRGQAVFNSEKTACMLCHRMGHRGGNLGPDLTNIGRIRNERELLEAVIFPSATFVRGYEPFNVHTTSGDAHTGILKKDAPDEVILATGPDSEQRITRGAIKDFEPGTISAMPPGMDAVLTPQELGDLVVFLKSAMR